jgi:hypothetical protein
MVGQNSIFVTPSSISDLFCTRLLRVLCCMNEQAHYALLGLMKPARYSNPSFVQSSDSANWCSTHVMVTKQQPLAWCLEFLCPEINVLQTRSYYYQTNCTTYLDKCLSHREMFPLKLL